MAERILMNEFKMLSKEKWVNVEVCMPTVLYVHGILTPM